MHRGGADRFGGECTLSVQEFEVANISVFPNPFIDTIQIESDVELKSVHLIDILGQDIFNFIEVLN